jgi:periplasmic protein CpxP/Spy
MTYIKNNKILVFIIAVLLLSNIAMLVFFLRKEKREDKPRQSPREFMISKLKEEVGFNDDQIAKYVELSDKHKQKMKPMFNDIHMAKENFYKLLLEEPSDSSINQYLLSIGEKQKSIDQSIFNHFLALKHVCTPDQLPKYDSLIQDVIKGMINPPKKGSDKKKNSK